MECFSLLFYFTFHLFLMLTPFFFCSFSILCNHHDYSALLQFKNSLAINTEYSYDGSSFPIKTKSWKRGTNCCEWDGVTCDSLSGHVVGLDLSCSHLKGEFHPNSTIFQLKFLKQLNLAFNDFSDSSIYVGIGDLVNLKYLNLSYAGFRGEILSTISHLSKLVSLDLMRNSMRVAPITWNKLILNATNLREIYLYGVDLSSVKESSLLLLMNLSSSLVSLSLRDTQLEGNFPTNIFSLPILERLYLSDNTKLSGQLAKYNWSSHLRSLDLTDISFSGKIPNSIGHLKSLNELLLSQCYFYGLIPPSLSNLTRLTFLALGHNNFSGSIPQWCFSLPSLLALYLQDNRFTGSIGEFSTYSLEVLDLSNNKLQGDFPNSTFELKNLIVLDLSSTKLSGLVNFQHFSKLKKLNSLYLSDNSFLTINIDHSFDSILPNLEILDLSYSNINSFPTFLANIQKNFRLDLSNNEIHGKIPKWFHEVLLHSWKSLYYVDLSFNKLQGSLPIPSNYNAIFLVSNNNFTGSISPIMCNVRSLEILNLAHNNLTGMIPQCLGTLPFLYALDMQTNNLYGSISPIMCNASSLEILNLAYNNLTGMIPQCLGTLSFLSVLDMQMNNLYGSFPGTFPEENAIETIKLNGNRLEGPLPHSLAHCTKLEVLDLGDNEIEDIFPNWLGTLQELHVLILRSNKLNGAINCSGINNSFPKLRIFDVSNNNLSGRLPTSCIKNFKAMVNSTHNQTGLQYMGYNSYYYNDSVMVVMKGQDMELERILTAFTTIDLSSNLFEGEIPQVIGELHSLKGLNLSHNRIKGNIPLSLSNLKNLESLDLSMNQLTGEIPMALTNLNFLSFLNLSQNQLEEIIPTGKQFNTFENASYEGNPFLCGSPLLKLCKNDEEGPPHSTVEDEEDESLFGWKPVAIGFACGTIFGMLLGYNVFLTGKPQWLARLIEDMFNTTLRNRKTKRASNLRRMN